MKTLIELYDERPIENILASEVFKPERTVFMCPPGVAGDKRTQNILKRYFAHKGLKTELEFYETSLFNSKMLADSFRNIIKKYPDCVVDITGGTDAALFACGAVCHELNVPAFTYSRRRNCFFSIKDAPFENTLPCSVEHTVADCFAMAGGSLRTGRVDNGALKNYIGGFGGFFKVYLGNKKEWKKSITYFQHVPQNENDPLSVNAPKTIRAARENVTVSPKLLSDLRDIGYIKDLEIKEDRVRFCFADRQIKTWLRDIGGVLELYVYKECLDTGIFGDVCSSAVVDWNGEHQRDSVTNEIDVMAMQGVLPVFISCKTCAIDTDALNELAILKNRFGGKSARAVIVSTQYCRSVTRNRASDLGIEVIDLENLKRGSIAGRIKAIVNAD